MATPSEVLMKRCHDCEVTKPVAEFLVIVSGKRIGERISVCTKCLNRSEYPPAICGECKELRIVSDFDPQTEHGKICKACILSNPGAYLKICTKCGIERLALQFSRQGRTAYRNPVCQACDTKRTIQKNKRKPRTVAIRRKRHSDRLKAEAYAAYGGATCACCGETEISFLTLDHIANDGARWRKEIFRTNKGRGGLSTYAWCKRNGYPPIFQVLCWNCQWGKVLNAGTCPHQKTCNDYPQVGVGSSDPKRFGSAA